MEKVAEKCYFVQPSAQGLEVVVPNMPKKADLEMAKRAKTDPEVAQLMAASGAPKPLNHLPEHVLPPPVAAKKQHGNARHGRHKTYDENRGRGGSGAGSRGTTQKARTTVAVAVAVGMCCGWWEQV